jgi:ketosteroid isomerase-like protein
MQSWLATKLITLLMGRLRAGDPRLLLATYAPDVALTFPGQNSWSGEYRGKPAVSQWLRRFVATGIQLFPDEVIAAGPPWRTSLLVRARGQLIHDGAAVYDNRFVIWGRMRWGRLADYEVYEDTQKANELDAWLAEHRPDLFPATVSA